MIQYLPIILKQLKLTVKGCIHIGAHWGQEYPLYKHLGIKNLLFYEPLKNNFDILKKNVGPEVILRNVALGNTSGTIEMFVEEANQSMSCSVLEPKHHLKQYPHIVFPKKQKVEITKLDLENFDKSFYNFINIDVQGYELEVFKGATETLKNINLIFSEINKEEMYKDCARVNELDSYLETFGFKRIATDWEGDTWGNGVYFKQ